RTPLYRGLGDGRIVEQQRPAIDGVITRQEVQQGGLAAAIGADQAVDLPFGQGQGDSIDGGDAAESLGNAVGAELAHDGRPSRMAAARRGRSGATTCLSGLRGAN